MDDPVYWNRLSLWPGWHFDVVIRHEELLSSSENHKASGALDGSTVRHIVKRLHVSEIYRRASDLTVYLPMRPITRTCDVHVSSRFASSCTAACVKNMERVEQRCFAAASTLCSRLSGRLN